MKKIILLMMAVVTFIFSSSVFSVRLAHFVPIPISPEDAIVSTEPERYTCVKKLLDSINNLEYKDILQKGSDDCTVQNAEKNVKIVFDGIYYETVTSEITGRVWLDRNLGASQVATSATDSNSFGGLYQWGRGKDGHGGIANGGIALPATTDMATDYRDSGVGNAFIVNISGRNLNDWIRANRIYSDEGGLNRMSAWKNNGINDICPPGFSVPTKEELGKEININTGNTTTNTKVFNSFLKIPTNSYRSVSNGRIYTGNQATLWTRSISPVPSYYRSFESVAFIADNSSSKLKDSYRGNGYGIRCIKDK